jgi:hypothetical protein
LREYDHDLALAVEPYRQPGSLQFREFGFAGAG